MSALEDVATIVPLAVATAGSCWRLGKRIRSPSKIQKIAVVIPDKAGKTTLCRTLGSHDKVLVDCGEVSKVFDKDGMVERVGEDTTLVDAVYDGLLDECYEFVRKLIKTSKKKQGIFFTSNVAWCLKRFKPDSIFCLVPSHDFLKSLPGCEVSRSRILSHLPPEVVKTYSSFEELEALLRTRFNISHSL